jgi:hypothetical protein
MKFEGIMTDLEIDIDEYDWEIEDAVLTASKIALDWTEDGEQFHLVAHSKDGGHTYKGNYGYPAPNKDWVMELERYSGPNKSVLLIARWHQTDNGNAGANLIELTPKDD